MRRWLLCMLPALFSGAGCLADSGDRHAGLTRYDDDAGRFRVYYQSPPWKEAETLAGGPGDAFVVEIDSPYGELAGTGRRVYRLGISLIGEAAEPAARRIEAEILSAGHELLHGVEPVESATEDAGFDLTWQEPSMMGRYGRVRTYATSFGAVLVRIEANPNPRNQDIERMLDLIDAEPEGDAPDGGP